MFFDLAIFKYLLIGVAILLLHFILKFIILPWRRVNSYKNDKIQTYFFPLFGIFYPSRKAVSQRGDFLAISKESSKLYPNQKYIVTNLLNNTIFFLRDTVYFREFLQKAHLYQKSNLFTFTSPLGGQDGQRGLAFAEGETWKRHRKIVSTSFHYEFIKSNIPLIHETAQEFLDKITPADFKGYPMIYKIQEITGEVVGRIFFGKNMYKYRINGRTAARELGALVGELSLLGKSPLAMIFGERILSFPLFHEKNKLLQRTINFRKLCYDIINERKASKDKGNDLLASLLATQTAEDPEQRYTDDNIINEFITFFAAGMETTGHLIAMTFYNLSQYPQYLKELEEERKNTYYKEVTADSLAKMDFLHSLLKETLRVYPPAPYNFFRVAQEDHTLHDLEIKKGQFITTDMSAVFFNEKYYQDPEKFDPTRWMKNDPKFDPYAFTPFSAGPRNCIGQHLAILEAKIIISEFLKRFDFKLKDGYKLRMTLRFLYEPDEELLFYLSPRQSSR